MQTDSTNEIKPRFFSSEMLDEILQSDATYIEDIQTAVGSMEYGQLQVTLRIVDGAVEDVVIQHFIKKKYKRLKRPDLNHLPL